MSQKYEEFQITEDQFQQDFKLIENPQSKYHNSIYKLYKYDDEDEGQNFFIKRIKNLDQQQFEKLANQLIEIMQNYPDELYQFQYIEHNCIKYTQNQNQNILNNNNNEPENQDQQNSKNQQKTENSQQNIENTISYEIMIIITQETWEKQQKYERDSNFYQENYQQIEKLGSGGFGEVYKAIDNKTKKKVAVKIMKQGQKNQNYNISQMIREFKILEINSDHILQYFDCFYTLNNDGIHIVYLVMELMETSLDEIIEQNIKDKKEFNPLDYYDFFLQILQGLKILNDQNIYHRDIKPDNILCNKIDDKYQFKIGDFNTVKVKNQTLLSSITGVGTPKYKAPEYKDNPNFENIDLEKCDIYSLAITFIEIIYAPDILTQNLYQYLPEQEEIKQDSKKIIDLSQEEINSNIKQQKLQNEQQIRQQFKEKLLKKTGNTQLVNLLEKMTDKMPENRPSIDEVMREVFYLKNVLIQKNFDEQIENEKKENEIIIKYIFQKYKMNYEQKKIPENENEQEFQNDIMKFLFYYKNFGKISVYDEEIKQVKQQVKEQIQIINQRDEEIVKNKDTIKLQQLKIEARDKEIKEKNDEIKKLREVEANNKQLQQDIEQFGEEFEKFAQQQLEIIEQQRLEIENIKQCNENENEEKINQKSQENEQQEQRKSDKLSQNILDQLN
ncbi:Protein kinase-like domain [Pseudocohnilembus persalinus]|uniref:Protein kinase-like domain n=1 Tax=Pseudocohnilembus persalinus TaxID=266149 RepID=A0A0V0QMR5_PSEPJ|nr:Protein kinase-like domain [Pseudocohnilembus persalinus]|eukprot:KRX03361.1 Protein kinase-like domain [Pseudocohnilembus persalinus]